MKLNYTFKDPHSGITFKHPEGLNDLLSEQRDKLFSLKANNGKGKSWLMTFIISSLIEFPERMKNSPSPLLVMTDELLDKVQQLREFSSGRIQGELQIELGNINVQVKYEYDETKPQRRFAPIDEPKNWSDLDDTILARNARFCYLIPENPTKRIQGIKTNIKKQLIEIGESQSQAAISLKSDYRTNTSNIRNPELITEYEAALDMAKVEKKDKFDKLERLQEDNQQFSILNTLKGLRDLFGEFNRMKSELKELKSEIKEMPKIRSTQEEDDILKTWRNAQRSIDSSQLSNIVRFISLLGEEEFNDFGDFQNQYVSELNAVSQLGRLNDFFEQKFYDSNPFLNSDKQALSKYRKILLQPSLTSDIIDFFTKATAISTAEQEGLAAIKELIKWLEERSEIADHLLRDKLRLNVSSQRLLSMLQVEERNMVEQEKLNQLAQQIENKLSQIPDALDEFAKLKKDFLKAKKNHDDLSRASSAGERDKQLQKRDKFRSLQEKLGKAEANISTRSTFITNKAPLLKIGTVSEITASIGAYTKQNPRASIGVEKELQTAEQKHRQQVLKVQDLEDKLKFESDKCESAYSPEELEAIQPYLNLKLEFAKFCGQATNLFSETTPTPLGGKIRDLFGDVAKNQLGGEILFDGVKRELISVDFNIDSLVYKDNDGALKKLPWNRLSTGNSAALFLNSTLYNVIQESKSVVALIDEVGDMTSDSRSQAFQSVRQNASQFALFIAAEPKEGQDFEIIPLK